MIGQPKGLGMWVAFETNIHGGYEALINDAARYGIGWIAPRLGQRGRSIPKARHTQLATRAAALNVGWYPWLYNCPDTTVKEVGIYQDLLSEGASGILLDAEDVYVGPKENPRKHFGTAERFMTDLRAALPSAWIAHCPYSYVGSHEGHFPYVQFGSQCDAVMDQLYWTEFNTDSAAKHIARTDLQWETFRARNPQAAKIRAPIGITYGHELPVQRKPPGELKVEDVAVFLDWCASRNLPFYSLYSHEAARPEVLQLLASRALQSPQITLCMDPYYDEVRQQCTNVTPMFGFKLSDQQQYFTPEAAE
jgi:hypothetical protein